MQDNSKKISLLTLLLSGIRHRWLVYFRPCYTIASLLRRKGKCQRCGRCDVLNAPYCRHFEDNQCKAYDRQPFFCRIFPIDPKDKEMSGVSEECGYWWESEKERKL